jgi:hypothetical protein
VSVGLAFGVAEFRERRANRELVARVLISLQAEVEHNLAEIEPYLSVHRTWADSLDKADTSNAGQCGLDLYLALRPALPKSGVAE